MKLILYGKSECSLCDEMKEVLARVRTRTEFELETRSIEDEPEARRLYWKDIPVLLQDGRVLFRHRVTEQALSEALRERGAERS